MAILPLDRQEEWYMVVLGACWDDFEFVVSHILHRVFVYACYSTVPLILVMSSFPPRH
jgi:hypothetical protein